MIGKFEVYEYKNGFFDSLDDESKEYIVDYIHMFLDPGLHEVVIFQRPTSFGDRIYIRYKRKGRLEHSMPIEIGFNKDHGESITRTEAESRYQYSRSSCSAVAQPTNWIKECIPVDCKVDSSKYIKIDPDEVYKGGFVEIKFRGLERVMVFRG